MLLDDFSPKMLADFERNIKFSILRRASGSIRHLSVEIAADSVVITGIVCSYHAKQLVLQGVLDEIGSLEPSCIQLKVDVLTRQTQAELQTRSLSPNP